MKRFTLKSLALLIAVSSLVTMPFGQSEVSANHAVFDKNYLIADSLFTSTNSMSVAQIQQWLDDNGGTLLANWVDDVDMRRPSDNCIVHHATGMTAAEIIHEAANGWGAQVYDGNGCSIQDAYWSDPGYSNYTLQTVSPKAILVLLQKEQSLISANGTYSSDPNDYKNPTCCSSNEYKLARATGYGVPDSGSINEKYLGFYNQINWASWQLRYNYERSAGNTDWDEVSYLTYTGPFIEGNFKACGSCSTIARSGYHTIDGSPLYMDNQATASLYYYTPHTYPGFYGNYNFVQFYTDWFGTTKLEGYQWNFVSQGAFTDSSMTTSKSLSALVPGDRVYLKLVAENVGTVDWDRNGAGAVLVGTEGPRDRNSQFCDSTWLTCRRPTRMNETTVTPGNNATFEFWYNVPLNQSGGIFQERFNLLSDGVTWMPDQGVNYTTTVQSNTRSWSVVSQRAYTDSSKTTARSIANLAPGDQVFLELVAKNTGSSKWTNGGTAAIYLGTEGPRDRNSQFCDSTWATCRRPTTFNEGTVLPGQNATFDFWYTIPNSTSTGTYKERFNLLANGVKWLPDTGLNYTTVVQTPNREWSLIDQKAYTDASKTTQRSIQNLNPGDRVYLRIVARNDGTQTWHNSGTGSIWAGTEGPRDRSSDFCDGSWHNCRRPSRLIESAVAPGQSGTFEFWHDVPGGQPSGTYIERFNLLFSGVTWMPDTGLNFTSVVQ